MAHPYKTIKSGINVSGGGVHCEALPFPSRTFISALTVVQTGGIGVVFSVEVLDRSEVCEGYSLKNDHGSGPGPDPLVLYRVMPAMTNVLPAHYVQSFSTGIGWPFFNMDGDAGLGNQRLIYIQISPIGSGNKEFALSAAGSTDLM